MKTAKGIPVPGLFLLSGHLSIDDQGRLDIKDRSLLPVRNRTVLMPSMAVEPPSTGLDVWLTDSKGQLCRLGSGSDKDTKRPALHHFVSRVGAQIKIRIPSREAFLATWAAKGAKWKRALATFVSEESGTWVELEVHRIKKAKMVAPNDDNPQTDKAYTDWYHRVPEDTWLHALVLGRIRAIVFELNAKVGEKAGLCVYPPNSNEGITLPVRRSGESAWAIHHAQDLEAGLYTFKVIPHGQVLDSKWSQRCRDDGGYHFREMVRFSIRNLAGEFDHISADPLSVEEAMMTQFPLQLAHLVAASQMKTDLSGTPEAKSLHELPQAIQGWANRVKTARDKSKTAIGLLDTASGRGFAKEIGKVVWASLKEQGELDRSIKAMTAGVELSFSIRDNVGKWRRVRRILAANKELEGVKKVVWSEVENRWERGKWWKLVKDKFADNEATELLELDKLSESERAKIFKNGVPEKQSQLEQLLGRAGKGVDIGLFAADEILTIYETALAIAKVSGAASNLGQNKRDLAKLCGQLEDKLEFWACREAIGNLERYRTATITGSLELEDAVADAAVSAVDAVLGVLTLIPVTAHAASLILLVKETAKLAADLVTEVTDYLDHLGLTAIAEFQGKLDQLYKLQDAVRVNQELLSEDRSNWAHVQFRLRAEALYGLFGLLTRAGYHAENEDEYLKLVKEYRVKEYIETILLGEGWQFPVRPFVPISLDTFWLYSMDGLSPLRDPLTLRKQLGFTRPLTLAAVSPLPGSMFVLAVADDVAVDHVAASYQTAFPIHRMEAKNVDELAKAFRTIWDELDADCVDYTCIYTRPPGEKGNGGWKPICPADIDDWDDLAAISPLDQIRVLVVLKKDVKPGVYPIKLRLYRADGLNIKGPEYHGLVKQLDKELLGEEKRKFHQRLGFVFFPFYQFGPTAKPGIKPMARNTPLGAGLYRMGGYLTDMRYAFRVQIGSGDQAWVKLGTANCGEKDLNEIRVTVGTGENELKLVEEDFLKSHTTNALYPQLFEGSYNTGAALCSVRVDKQKFQTLHPDEGGVFKLSHLYFGWNQSVELIVIVWGDRVSDVRWERTGFDRNKIPFEMDLVSYHGWDTEGPHYRTTLFAIGDYYSGGIEFKQYFSSGKHVGEWMDQINQDAAVKKNLRRLIKHKGKGALYAAHFKLHYVAPDGTKVEGLRPFDKVLEFPDYYRIGLTNLRGAPNTELSFGNTGEIHFQAPDSKAAVPWSKCDLARVKTWIEDEPKAIDPRVEIVKGV